MQTKVHIEIKRVYGDIANAVVTVTLPTSVPGLGPNGSLVTSGTVRTFHVTERDKILDTLIGELCLHGIDVSHEFTGTW